MDGAFQSWEGHLHGGDRVKWTQAIQDDSDRVSSTRISLLIATVTLSISTAVLTFAVLWNPELVPALSITAGGLAGMSGAGYVSNRFSPRRGRVDNPDG